MDEVYKMALAKYRKGAEEHGGNLWDLSEDELLDEAINEAIDQVIYLLTIKLKKYENRTTTTFKGHNGQSIVWEKRA